MPTMQLPKKVHQSIQSLCKEGDALSDAGKKTEAWDKYVAALQLVPEPAYEWEAATWILAAMGDVLFEKRDYARALGVFEDAVRCAGGLGNAFIHLRLGECHYELGHRDQAADDLARAYMAAGRKAFAKEDPKDFRLVEEVLKPPAGMDRLP